MINSGLGRGLSSLIPNLSQDDSQLSSAAFAVSEGEKIILAPLAQIEKNPFQPRENFSYEEMEDLVESVKKHGILQPLIVSKTEKGYQLIAGERRLRAAQILELEKIPAIVRNVAEAEKLELALIENIQRQNLNPLEEAYAYKKLIDEFSLTQEQVADKVGKKRATISNILRLLDLPQEIQKALAENKITIGHAKVILSQEGRNNQLKLLEKILQATLSVRQAEGEVKKVKVKGHERSLEKDPEVLGKEERLRAILNTKVKINKKGQTGNIAIDFYSNEELENLVRLIESSKND